MIPIVMSDIRLVGFSSMILWWVRVFNEFEVSGMPLQYLTTLIRTSADQHF